MGIVVAQRLCELADPKPAPCLPRSWDEIDIGHLVRQMESPIPMPRA
jgi:hypothetical protein